jgi:mannosyltransferase
LPPLDRCPPRPARVELAWLVLVLVAAAALRAYHLGLPTLTGDEWFMLRNHDEGPAWIVRQARVFEPHPLLYYLGFWAWVELTGSSEWAMRYPSALFGVLTCAAVWRLARDAAGPPAGAAAVLLVAINPYQVAQAQNARNYAMVAALATLATAALLVATRRGGRAWHRYAALLLLALHTHLNAVLVAAAHALWVLVSLTLRRARPDPAAKRAGLAVVVLFLPWLAYAWPALTAYQGFYPERVTLPEVLVRTLGTFAYGQTPPPRRALIALAGAPLLAAAALAAWRAWRRRDDRPLLVTLTAGLPVVGTALVFLVRPMFEERYLIVAAPTCLALIAIGALAIGRSHALLRLTLVGGLAVATAPFLRDYYPTVAASRPDWRGLAAWVAERERPGDVALVTGHGVADAYGYYRRAAAPIVLAADDATAARDVEALLGRSPRGAFLLPYWESPPDRVAHDALVARGFADQARWFRGQRVQYVALPTPDDPAPRASGAVWLDAIELTSAAVASPRVAPGEAVRVALSWRARAAAPDLKISLRLQRPGGDGVAQLDRRPVDESRPFPSMRPGETVRDGHLLWTPPDLPPGPYRVALLLYRPEDARAVAPVGADGDLVALGSVDVAR